MSVMIQSQAALSPMPAAPVAVSLSAVVGGIARRLRDAAARAMKPSYADRHGKDFDILCVSRPHGYGRDSFGWNDIGYKF